jgi:predicted nucleic acid-binding protein
VLLDAGPLVAFLNRRDRHYAWAEAQWNQIAPPMLTCEAVLSEACFLLSQTPLGSRLVVQLLERGVFSLPFRLEDQVQAVTRLLEKYRSVPMSLADACLVRMSELFPSSTIVTVDTDFGLYRRHGRQVIPAIIPD